MSTSRFRMERHIVVAGVGVFSTFLGSDDLEDLIEIARLSVLRLLGRATAAVRPLG
ncbi:hypothetical protein [Nocardia sp. CA-135398]|uniref:hypothetical protein n=1 Tax=Nocardia sp. CA-135398 TaxID=3239977 RepID=UPI003D97FA65